MALSPAVIADTRAAVPGLMDQLEPTLDAAGRVGLHAYPLGWLRAAQAPDCHLCTIRRNVAGRQLCVMGKRAAVRTASTPCQLRVTSFASKSHLVDRHPLDVPAIAAPHVRASHYGLRLAHCSKQYDHGPKIATDWQDHYRLANAIGYCEAVGRVYAGLITALTTQEVPALQAGAFWPANQPRERGHRLN